MGYHIDDSHVRVDFFKESGMWYGSEEVVWAGSYKGLIYEAFAHSLREHFKECPGRFSDMDAVCLEPYHEYAHPIMIRNGGWRA